MPTNKSFSFEFHLMCNYFYDGLIDNENVSRFVRELYKWFIYQVARKQPFLPEFSWQMSQSSIHWQEIVNAHKCLDNIIFNSSLSHIIYIASLLQCTLDFRFVTTLSISVIDSQFWICCLSKNIMNKPLAEKCMDELQMRRNHY